MLQRVSTLLRLITEAHLQGVFNLKNMGKRIIFTEEGSELNPEIEMFVNSAGKVAIIVKYENDSDADCRVVQLNPDDFTEMITIVNTEIQNNILEE